MIRLGLNKFIIYLGVLSFMYSFTSCITNKELEYFNVKETDKLDYLNDYDYHLQVNDLLSIQINSITEDKYDFFNNDKVASSNMLSYNPYLFGFLIEKDGLLELPMLGKINVVGKTTQELERVIQEKSKEYFKDPVVKINILNFELDVLGEVRFPQRYRIVDSKINIFDVIAMAGDITEEGNRKKVKVIRLTDKNPRVIYLDLSDKNVASNANFFLQPNDIIYISPTNKRFYAFKSLPSVFSLGISAISLYLLINKE